MTWSADRTERASDLTERPVDPTQRESELTERPANATVRSTAARTIHDAEEQRITAFSPTRDGAERTEIIQERLVKSLDDVGAARYGELRPGVVVKQRFLLEKLIGKGGMGLVFAAVDRRKQEANDPNPRVAFKVLNADFQRHPQSLMALQREARKAQSLAHPNVVTVFDFDRDGDAIYMTMELLKGRSLESLVREARGNGVPPKAALPIIRGIAEGLAYAHRKGIVHSDLKPGNVFIVADQTPKILDFGIARAVPNQSTDELPDEFDAGMLGAYTEAYATQEMVQGVDPHPADDMYALGIIAYELLIGEHPYQRHSAPKARQLGLKPASLKGLKRHEARALERCLSFDRKARPQNAAEFLKAFRGVTPLQKASIAATVVLAITAAYLSYENYRETSPTIPFSELPMADQVKFAESMAQGDEGWRFYANEHNEMALYDALDGYADAYRVHPRNREATVALRKVADAFLETSRGHPEQRRVFIDRMQLSSDYYLRYGPVVEAAQESEATR